MGRSRRYFVNVALLLVWPGENAFNPQTNGIRANISESWLMRLLLWCVTRRIGSNIKLALWTVRIGLCTSIRFYLRLWSVCFLQSGSLSVCLYVYMYCERVLVLLTPSNKQSLREVQIEYIYFILISQNPKLFHYTFQPKYAWHIDKRYTIANKCLINLLLMYYYKSNIIRFYGRYKNRFISSCM